MTATNNFSDQQPSLTVYKASAGSGKTFTLATEYMKRVIENPDAYRSILAVTFTNKATEEMKMRILSQLYGIAHGLPDSDSYLQKIQESIPFPCAKIRERAQKALGQLLHNYNYFRVETIDAFFQSVLRNLARELDLTANLRIELRDKQVKEKAVDELIEELQPNDKLLRWIYEYIRQNISDDKSWNVIGEIKDFGSNIFKDVYKAHRDELESVLSQDNFFVQYTKQLRNIRDRASAEFSKMGEAFNETLNRHQASIDDLKKGKTGAAGYFIKLSSGKYDDDKLFNATAQKAADAPEEWLRKGDQKDEGLMMLATELTNLLNTTEQRRRQLLVPFRTATLILRHLNQLRLLGSIEKKVRELNADSNSFLLSDTQLLLNKLIEDSDSPFIFEKIGTQLKHIMIDEFQDTSTIQWQNFKILLKEVISHADGTGLIVGDVKQSIYRFRSGDWRLLNNIEQEFSSQGHLLETLKLDVNRRSEKNIIDFNNTFFTIVARKEYEALATDNPEEAEQVKKAYKDVCQKAPDEKVQTGFANIKLFPKEDYENLMVTEIAQIITTLKGQGVRQKDIAILVRNNKEIPTIADALMESMPEIRLVSDEAFRLDSSIAVNLLIDALHCLMHPEDKIALANLSKVYQKRILNNKLDDNDLFIQEKDVTDWLPKEFTQQADSLLTLPPIDLVERLFAIFQLDTLKDQSAYICEFYDLLNQYLTDNITGLDNFLEQWNETLHDKTIQSDGFDGIRILTIHKSKGLEFDHVIIPFCDWQLERRYTLWCRTDAEPFCQLPLIPIDFSEKSMTNTFFEPDYQHEHLQNMVDNLNLLYVALTRAGKSLFILGQRKSAGRRSKVIEESVEEMHKALSGSILTGDMDNKNDTISLEFGTLSTPKNETKKASENIFQQPVKTLKIEIESFDNMVEFRQSNQSKEFVSQDEEPDDRQSSYIQLGNILHQLFSQIKTADDVEAVLKQLEFDGVLYDDVVTREKLQEMLNKRLNHPKVASWFSGKWKLFNECSILHVNPTTGEVMTHRPDRVMTDGQQMIVVDFKFGQPKPQHIDQVKQYMQLLTQMGHAHVTGYLWYVYSNKIEEVI